MKSVIAAVLVAALVGAWWLARSPDSEAPPASADAGQPVDHQPVMSPAAPPDEPALAPLPEEPPFRERLRAFLAAAPRLPEAQRNSEAEALRRKTLAREAERSLLPAESAYIQLALLRATISDEVLLRRRSEALLAEYEAASEAGWREYRRREDPRHEAYRTAEAEVIRRARADKLSDAELQERLQSLREEHYD